jgi:hypothetical protein
MYAYPKDSLMQPLHTPSKQLLFKEFLMKVVWGESMVKYAKKIIAHVVTVTFMA